MSAVREHLGGLSTETRLHDTLVLAVAMCFIGHGAFGIITKPVWCNYFAVVGIDHEWAYRLMPIVGTVDVFLGILMLARPMRAILVWAVLWGTWTAALRPLSGEPFAELVERAGNFGAPLALLLLAGGRRSVTAWLARIPIAVHPSAATLRRLNLCLRILAGLLLLGHGWLNLLGKQSLLDQYTRLGFSRPVAVAHAIGWFEVALAGAVLLRPTPRMLLMAFLWKAGSELFYPSHPVLEWIERGGSYGVLFALWLMLCIPSTRPVGFTIAEHS